MKKYGIDFRNNFYERDIDCMFCGRKYIRNLDCLLIHLNDEHSESHKQTADLLEQMSKKYNLLTGERIIELNR